jgi:hypothetical protein
MLPAGHTSSCLPAQGPALCWSCPIVTVDTKYPTNIKSTPRAPSFHIHRDCCTGLYCQHLPQPSDLLSQSHAILGSVGNFGSGFFQEPGVLLHQCCIKVSAAAESIANVCPHNDLRARDVSNAHLHDNQVTDVLDGAEGTAELVATDQVQSPPCVQNLWPQHVTR